MHQRTMKLGIIEGSERGRTLDVPKPKFSIGDRLILAAPNRPDNPEVIIERIEGPSYYYGSDRRNPWMYRLREKGGARYPTTGEYLRAIPKK